MEEPDPDEIRATVSVVRSDTSVSERSRHVRLTLGFDLYGTREQVFASVRRARHLMRVELGRPIEQIELEVRDAYDSDTESTDAIVDAG